MIIYIFVRTYIIDWNTFSHYSIRHGICVNSFLKMQKVPVEIKAVLGMTEECTQIKRQNIFP